MAGFSYLSGSGNRIFQQHVSSVLQAWGVTLNGTGRWAYLDSNICSFEGGGASAGFPAPCFGNETLLASIKISEAC